MSERWTEGVCGDGAAILWDGVPVPIAEVLAILNRRVQPKLVEVALPLFTCSKCGVNWRGGVTNGLGLCGSCDETL